MAEKISGLGAWVTDSNENPFAVSAPLSNATIAPTGPVSTSTSSLSDSPPTSPVLNSAIAPTPVPVAAGRGNPWAGSVPIASTHTIVGHQSGSGFNSNASAATSQGWPAALTGSDLLPTNTTTTTSALGSSVSSPFFGFGSNVAVAGSAIMGSVDPVDGRPFVSGFRSAPGILSSSSSSFNTTSTDPPAPGIGAAKGFGFFSSRPAPDKPPPKVLTTWVEPVMAGEWDRVEAMLRELPDADIKTKEFGGSSRGVGFMSMVARAGRPDLLRLALQKGADPEEIWEATDYNGRAPAVSPLWAACGRNDLESALILLNAGARCQQVNPRSCGINDNCFMRDEVLKAHPEYKDNIRAIKNEILKKCGVARDPDGGYGAGDKWSPLYWAVVHNNADMLRALVDIGGGDVCERSRLNSTLFSLAASLDRVDIMARIVSLGFDPLAPPPKAASTFGYTNDSTFPPVSTAAAYLACVNEYSLTPPRDLIIPGCRVGYQNLFDYRSEQDLKAEAAELVRVQLARQPLSRNADGARERVGEGGRGEDEDGDEDDDDGGDEEDEDFDEVGSKFALFQCPTPEICQALIDAGADMTIRNRFGATPIWNAFRHGQEDVAGVLLRNGADIHVANYEHEWESSDYLMAHSFPLHCVVHWSQTAEGDSVARMAKMLLDRGANPLVVNSDGHTPLYMALYSGYLEAVAVIADAIDWSSQTLVSVEKGVPPDVTVFGGRQPHYPLEVDEIDEGVPLLHLAASCGAWGVLERLLKLADCDVNSLKEGRTALHYLCNHGREFYLGGRMQTEVDENEETNFSRAASVLMTAGIDATKADRTGDTALHWLSYDSLVKERSIAAVIVASAGSGVLGLTNTAGLTPLAHLSAKRNRTSAVASLQRLESA